MGHQYVWLLFFVVGSSLLHVSAKTAADWRDSRRIVYQLITDRFAYSTGRKDTCTEGNCPWGNYCGGDYKGIEEKLDYIKGMNFNAVWISPVVDNIPCGYHGYWARNWNRTNENFGSDEDLVNLSNTLHANDVWLMVDIVANHVGPVGTDYSSLFPFNKPEYFHNPCSPNWADQASVEYCRLVDLPDLNSENDYVQSFMASWIKNLVEQFNMDAIRIDTAPYVPKWFWKKYTSAIAGTYSIGEVLIGGRSDEFVYSYATEGSMDSVLNYPLYWTLLNVFGKKKTLWELSSTINNIKKLAGDKVGLLGNFLDNHDQPRFLNAQPDWTLYKNGQTFVVAHEGIPMVYYGAEQGMTTASDDNANRTPLWKTGFKSTHHLYQFFAALNGLKLKGAFDGEETEVWVADVMYVFARGNNSIVVVSNVGSGQVASISIPLSNLPPAFKAAKGQKMCDALWAINNAKLSSAHNFHLSKPHPSRKSLRRASSSDAAESSDPPHWFPWGHKNDTHPPSHEHEVDTLCGIPHEHRKECGWFGITHGQCIHKGCCWQPSLNPLHPWCFARGSFDHPEKGTDVGGVVQGDSHGMKMEPLKMTDDACITIEDKVTFSIRNGQPQVWLLESTMPQFVDGKHADV